LTYTANDADAFQSESVVLTARDETLLSSSPETFQIITGAQLQTISVDRGWNFIAFAADPVDGPTELFVIDGVQHHRGKLWYLNNGNYVSAEELSGGVGYWAWFPDAATFVDVPGAPKSNELDIPAGWQGIGLTGSAAAAALPAGGITGTVWGWDVDRQRYINAVEFEHGKGYVVMSQGTTVTFEQP